MVGVGRPEVLREVVRVFWAARSSGLSDEAAAGVAGFSEGTASRIVRQHGGVDPSIEPACGRFLSFDERELIAVWRAQGCGMREIGRRLGRSPSTISRELDRNVRNGGRRPYLASTAQSRAQKQARRPKARKLAVNEALALYVAGMLTCRERLSPEQISARLRIDFPDDESMRISPETIYQCIYIQGRGGLRAELAAALRTGRAVRQPNRRPGMRRPRVPKELLISERPAEADDRAVPGHWEGDLVRHEALFYRAEVEGLRRCAVAAADEAGGSLTRETPGRVEAAPTTPGRTGTTEMGRVRQARPEGVREEPVLKPLKSPASSNSVDMGWPAVRTASLITAAGTWIRLRSLASEATVKVCGVAVAIPQGHSWAPNPSIGKQ